MDINEKIKEEKAEAKSDAKEATDEQAASKKKRLALVDGLLKNLATELAAAEASKSVFLAANIKQKMTNLQREAAALDPSRKKALDASLAEQAKAKADSMAQGKTAVKAPDLGESKAEPAAEAPAPTEAPAQEEAAPAQTRGRFRR